MTEATKPSHVTAGQDVKLEDDLTTAWVNLRTRTLYKGLHNLFGGCF